MNEAEQLANAHWEYVDNVLKHEGVSLVDRWRIGFHYKSAFVHGWKHGRDNNK
jgi:hypothetical protein